jgi:hypothetical protein
MLNPESIMPIFFRHLFRAGLVQHPTEETLKQSREQVQDMEG